MFWRIRGEKDLATTSQFKLERDRILNEVKEAQPGVEALRLLRKIRLEFDSAIEDYRNSLTILGDTTYEDRKHFLLELIQNADDAIYQEEDTRITFSIYENSLEISYNELGFTTNDVIAITGTGASTKTANKLSANSFIGEKGIGFKSVFALAKEVHIESGPWHFKLLKDNYIVPELINPSAENFTNGTKLRVYFSDPASVTIVANELLKLVTKQLESFLFLQKLKTFEFRDFRKSRMEPYKLTIHPDKESNKLMLQTMPEDIQRTYSLYEEEIEFPGHLVGTRWERLGSQHSLKRKMAVASITHSTTQNESSGRLFCYLPTEVKLPVPIFLQLDGHLKADRERLHDIANNSWNKYLLDRVPTFLLHAILKWREVEEVASRLPDYVPDQTGEDQLKNVFAALIVKCINAPWVKTFDGWSAPAQTVIADSFWYEWFEEYPVFRSQVEKVVGKKFMHPDWVSNSNWKTKWRKYQISTLTALQVAEILRFVTLPEGLLENNDNIDNLYKQLARLHENSRYSERREFIQELYYAKIFPLEGGSFGPLMVPNESTGKMYWMSGRTRRTSGLEGIIDVRIINPEYTYTPNISPDSSEERKAELKEISLRNELIKQVLRFMEVPEFSDDRLLAELQIPFILEKEEKWTTTKMETKYRVLQAIFDVYQAKRSFDEGYLSQLAKLSESYVLGSNGKIKKLYQTILPEKTRLYEEDHLYANAGLDSLHLTVEWCTPEFQGENQEEKLEVYFKQLRQFLIHCGIANSPKFFFKERKYSRGFEFRELEETLYNSWVKKINNDYTIGNAIVLKSVTLDTATLQIINNGKISIEIAKGLYQEWVHKFSRSMDRLDSLYYRFDPPPGYTQTFFKRFENRKPIIPDTHWAGLNRNQVPLMTIDGRLTNSDKAFKIRYTKGLDRALSFFDLVLENEGNGYHPFYLSSLEIKRLQTEDINRKWKEAGKESYDELMKAMYELSQFDVELSGLSIYDKVSDSFRPIRTFKLGKPVSPSTPYIEEQYGNYGKLLGVKLGLLVDSEVTPLLKILDDFFESRQTEAWIQTNLVHFLQQWSNLRADDRGKLIHHLTELKANNKEVNDILFIFNDKDLYQKFQKSESSVIHLTCDPMAIIQLKQAAIELGFVSLDEIGTIRAAEPTLLQGSEAENLVKMFEAYIKLEAEESGRLFAVLGKIGGKTDFYHCIRRADELTKMVYGISIPVTFPYYDSAKNHYYVSREDTLYDIAARLLSTFGFTTYRSGYRDFKEIYDKLVRPNRTTSQTIAEKAKKADNRNSYTDVPVEFDLVEPTHDEASQSSMSQNHETSSSEVIHNIHVSSYLEKKPFIQKQVNDLVEESHSAVSPLSIGNSHEMSSPEVNHNIPILNDTEQKPFGQKQVNIQTSEVHKKDMNTIPEMQQTSSVIVVGKSETGQNNEVTASNRGVTKQVKETVSGVLNQITNWFQGIPKRETEKKSVEGKDEWNESKNAEKKSPVTSFTLDDLLQQISEQMVQEGNNEDSSSTAEWKLAIDPEEGEHIRSSIADNLKTALQEGPVLKEVKERKKKEKVKIIDATAQDPKEFLHHEYDGRCQICSTQLKLANGKSYFEVYRIREGKDGAWWTNRPFNILSLCPNCHALAKHGGAIDFSAILNEAELVPQQLTFPQEVEVFNGDYYVIEIVHNGQSKHLVLSPMHLEYFSALLEFALEE